MSHKKRRGKMQINHGAIKKVSQRLRMSRGERLREEAMRLIEGSNAVFLAEMRFHARRLCKERGSVSTDDLRKIAKRRKIIPSHSNAWGAIFRGKEWRVIGRRKSSIASNHAREIRVWGLSTDHH